MGVTMSGEEIRVWFSSLASAVLVCAHSQDEEVCIATAKSRSVADSLCLELLRFIKVTVLTFTFIDLRP